MLREYDIRENTIYENVGIVSFSIGLDKDAEVCPEYPTLLLLVPTHTGIFRGIPLAST